MHRDAMPVAAIQQNPYHAKPHANRMRAPALRKRLPVISFGCQRLQRGGQRCVQRVGERRFAADEVFPADLEALAPSLARKDETVGRQRQRVRVVADVDLALELSFELRRHAVDSPLRRGASKDRDWRKPPLRERIANAAVIISLHAAMTRSPRRSAALVHVRWYGHCKCWRRGW